MHELTQHPSLEERRYAGLARVSSLLGLVVPFGNLFAPLCVCLVMPESAFVRDHAVSEAKYQTFWTVLGLAVVLLVSTLALCTFGFGVVLFVPALLLFLPPMLWWVTATGKAFQGERYRYPVTG